MNEATVRSIYAKKDENKAQGKTFKEFTPNTHQILFYEILNLNNDRILRALGRQTLAT